MAALPEKGAQDVLYLVDLSGYVFRAYHALPPLSSTKGEPTHAVLGTVNMLQKVVGEKRPPMMAVAMDTRGRTFRHELDSRYKATRPAPPPDFAQQMKRVEEIIHGWNVAVFRRDAMEADDLIAAATKRALEAGWRVVIVSADKDMMQLVRDDDERVVLWDSMRDKVYGPAEVREKLGVAPSRVRDYLALTGDTSDNVPGVPGVGPKTASDLLNQFGSLEAILAGLDKVTKPKLRESLREHAADARVSQKLVTLNAEAPIEWDLEKLRWGGADVAALRRLYTELEFNRQLDQLDALARAGGPAAPGADNRAAPAESAGPLPRAYACIVDAAALDRVVGEARARHQLGVAVETTSDDAMRGEVVGVSIAAAPGQGWYVPIAHRYLGCPAQLPWEKVKAALAPLLADAGVTKVGHDLKRASIVLARAGAPVAGPVFDTHVAAYLIDPESPNGLKELSRRELGATVTRFDEGPKGRGPARLFEEVDLEHAAAFAATAAELPLSLREHFEPRMAGEGLDALMRDVEMPLERVLADMEMRGVLVDVPTLEKLGRSVDEQLRALEGECKELAGSKDFAVRSRDQLEELLFDTLRLPVVKRTPKGGRSTDADVLEALAEKHPLPAKILSYRELDKLKGTYIEALPRCVNPKTGRIHTRFDQAVAATGRLSSADPNLQNIPIRTELGRSIRAAFVAPPGRVVMSADYSQIELRVLAHLAADAELIDAFASGQDVHARTAALVFDKKPADVTADERRAAKTINFGVIYGMGDSALAKQIGVSREQAARWIAAYFARYVGVARFMEKTIESARQGEAVRTLLGRRRFLPNLHSANRALRFEAERIARNTPIQGTAADILKLAMVKLGEGGGAATPGANMVLTVHDELVFEVDEGRVDAARETIRAAMAGAMKLAVPLVVDVGVGKNWADAH